MRHPPLEFISDLESLATALGVTCEEEARLRGVCETEVSADRLGWMNRGKQAAAFLRKWRDLNAISVASYSRLTGIKSTIIRKALNWGDITGILEPLTGEVRVSLRYALLQGYSYQEIELARQGKPRDKHKVFDFGDLR